MNDPADAPLALLEASADLLRIALAESVALPLHHLLSHSDDHERIRLVSRWFETAMEIEEESEFGP